MAVDDAVEKKSRRRRRNRDEESNEDEEASGLTGGKGRATPGKRSRKKAEEGGNFITRSLRGTRNYFAGVQDELDKVVWPTREELIRLSRIVLIVTIAAALVLGAFSIAFTELFIIGLEDEWVFLAFGAAVAVAYLYITRVYLRGQDNNPPPY
jgi:preprotein translocase subunit SecE